MNHRNKNIFQIQTTAANTFLKNNPNLNKIKPAFS